MKRQVADRLFLAALCMLVVAISFFEPNSMSYALVRIGRWPAQICMFALLAMSLLALADTVVNDMLPEPYVFKTGWRFRQGVWMLIAVTFTGLGFVTMRMADSYLMALVYWLYAWRCAAVSFLDLFYEHRDADRGRRSTDFGAF